MEPQIKQTADGSDTLYLASLDEHYHSLHGAWQESLHVFINQGLKQAGKSSLRIFEMGFGTGLNAFLTCIEAMVSGKHIDYTGIDLYPLNMVTIRKLNYPGLAESRYRDHFLRLHTCEWDIPSAITPFFTLTKIRGDIRGWEATEGSYDLVYFDAFAPGKQPELWKPEIFHSLCRTLVPGGLLVTYSAKGEVRRNLVKSGFRVEKIPGPPGKREMIRATRTEE